MRVARTIAVLFLSLWWIPATSYCALERAGIVQCNDCCTDVGNDCAVSDCGVGCNTPASTIPKTPVSLEKVTLALLPGELLRHEIEQADRVSATQRAQPPPDRLELVEFLGRTATPARAPALV